MISFIWKAVNNYDYINKEHIYNILFCTFIELEFTKFCERKMWRQRYLQECLTIAINDVRHKEKGPGQ